MTYSALRDGIEAAITTVADAGVVHDYWRFDANVKGYVEHFTTTIAGVTQVRAWLVQCLGMEEPEEGAFPDFSMIYRFEVVGYRSLNDATATEKEFWTLVEAVVRALAYKRNFSVAGVRPQAAAVTEVTVDHAMFADTLCHRARVTLEFVVDTAADWS